MAACLTCTIAAVLLIACPASRAATHAVSSSQQLAAAVAASAPGDEVVIHQGHYPVQLVVDRPLTLRGDGKPMLDGQGRGDVIRVLASDVRIIGLRIYNSGADLGRMDSGVFIDRGAHRARVIDCEIGYSLFGLRVHGAADVELSGNVITGKRDLQSAQRGNGIQLYNTIGARVIDNQISFARDGIYVDVSHHALFKGNRIHHVRYGTHYMNSNSNVWEGNWSYLNRGGLALMEVRNQVVRNNVTWGNTDHGIMLRTIQDSLIEGNVVIDNGKGLFVYDAEYNTLRGNLVAENRVGVHLWAGSYRNQVDGNDFIGNAEQIRYVATRDQPWGEQQGNFWSNYSGWDRDGDGRGDLPYVANDLVDRLVWRFPYVKIMLHSPAVHTLRMVVQQFPLLRAPSVVDDHPQMQPHHADWSKWLERTRH
jgi:nitrous oxidase accessory protein